MDRKLRKISNRQFLGDVKQFITARHEFYTTRVPEVKVLAKRLHEEYKLKEYYKVFNRLWKTKYHKEISLAIFALSMYKDEFDMETWKFIKSKFKDVETRDQANVLGLKIVGEIVVLFPKLIKEINTLANSKNICDNRIALFSLFPVIRTGDVESALKIIEVFLKRVEKSVHKDLGSLLRECLELKPRITKRFIMDNLDMDAVILNYAIEKDNDLSKRINLRRFGKDKRGWFWGRG